MTSCLCAVASPWKEGAERWIVPLYGSWVSRGPEEGDDPPKVTHQVGPGQSPGALLETTGISRAQACGQPCRVGWGQVKAEQEPSGTCGPIRDIRHKAVQWFQALTRWPQVPPWPLPSQHALGCANACLPPATAGGLMERRPLSEQRAAEKAWPCLPWLFSLLGSTRGARGGRQSEVHTPACLNVFLFLCVLGPRVVTGVSTPTAAGSRPPKDFSPVSSLGPHEAGAFLPFIQRGNLKCKMVK